jgi:protein-disulfide isomerase
VNQIFTMSELPESEGQTGAAPQPEMPAAPPPQEQSVTLNTVAYLITSLIFFALGFLLAGLIGFDLASESNDAEIGQAVLGTLQALAPPTPTAVPPELTYSDRDYSVGAEDAPITLVEFSDYRCPYCTRFELETRQVLMDRYEGLIKFVYRDYPIFGGDSIRASVAARCADEQGRFWDFHNAIFLSQAQEEPASLDNAGLVQLATQISMNVENFNTCMQDQAIIDEVLSNIDNAYSLVGGSGTPTFLMNGKVISGALPYQNFVQLIDAELRALGVEPPA